MSLDHPLGSSSADAPVDDTLIVDGLERALAQARTKIPNHDNISDALLPSLSASTAADVDAEVPFDSSAVMDVLRGAIARYTTGDGHEQGTWVDDDSRPASSAAPAVGARHAASAGYAPDRRRLAAVVVVLFLLVGGFGLQRFGGDSAEKVKTNTVPAQGQAVTTLARSTTSAVVVPATEAPPETSPPPAGSVNSPTPTTHRPGTTAPPTTAPSTTEPPTTEPDTTTTVPDTTTTVPDTTTTAPCGDPLPPC
ncbi:MAG: hypothetical protein QOI95_2986 [Acidimicrobiaceae bacterium]|jgi:hypothetical protein